MRTSLFHGGRRALIPVLIAGALGLGATAVSAIPPSATRNIPDAAFQPVTFDRPASSGVSMSGLEGNASTTPPIYDPWLREAPPAPRSRPPLPSSQPVAVARQAPGTSHSISGSASWYCDAGVSPCSSSYPDTTGFDAYGAAGPRLRVAIGSGWRGTVVTVDGIRVKLIDWCQCYAGQDNEKLIDLYHDVFLRTGSTVTIRW